MKMMFTNVSTFTQVKLFLERNSCQFKEEFEDDIECIELEIYDKEIMLKLHTEGLISEGGLTSIKELDVGDKLCFVYCKPLISKLLHLKYNTKKK